MCVQLDLQDVFIREVIPSSAHTHAQIDNAGLRGQCNARHCAICLVCGAEVGLSAAAGPFLKLLSEFCSVAATLSPSPLCCQSVRELIQKSRGLASPTKPQWEPRSQFPTCSRSRKRPDAHSQSCVLAQSVWQIPARGEK